MCQHRIMLHGFDDTGGRVGAAGVPKEYRHVMLGNSPVAESRPELYEYLAGYVKTFTRPLTGDPERIKSFYFWSTSPGTGKTTTAVALLNEYIVTQYVGAFWRGETPPERPAMFMEMNELQRQYSLAVMSDDKDLIAVVHEYADRAGRVPFLVIDDIGIRDTTGAFRSIVYSIIDRRNSAGLPTVYTSNVPMAELATLYDERIEDRIGDMCITKHFDGTTNRGKRGRRK